jgi:hypothetical protein
MGRKISFWWKVLMALSTILLCSIFIVPKFAYAVDESDSWVLPSNTYNEYQKIFSTDGRYIVQQGKHPKGSSNVFLSNIGYV